MEYFLIHYGIYAVAFLAFIEGDVTFILAGVVAHLGIFSFPMAIIIGAVFSFAGDCVWFWLGRKQAGKIRASRFYSKAGGTTEQLAGKFGAWEIILTRFAYGTRIASSVFWGTQNFRFSRFGIIDFLSCFSWTVLLTGLGYFMSSSAAALIGEIKKLEIWLFIAVVLAIGIYIVSVTVIGRRIKR